MLKDGNISVSFTASMQQLFFENSKCIRKWRIISKKEVMRRIRKLFPRDDGHSDVL